MSYLPFFIGAPESCFQLLKLLTRLLGRLGSFDSRNRGGVVGRVENRGAGDERVGAGFDDFVRVGGGNTAINLDPRVHTVRIAHGLDLRNLTNLRFDEALAAEPGVDAHHEDQVNLFDDVLQALGGGAGVQHDTRFAPQVLDLVHRAVQVDGGGAGVRVDGDDVRARLGEIRHAKLGFHDHEVAIQHLVRHRAERVDDEGADGDVGHETAVHHVDVDPLRASLVSGLDLFWGLNREGYTG